MQLETEGVVLIHREFLLCEAVLRSAREGRWVEVGT